MFWDFNTAKYLYLVIAILQVDKLRNLTSYYNEFSSGITGNAVLNSSCTNDNFQKDKDNAMSKLVVKNSELCRRLKEKEGEC
jgi:hypothetical protein